MNNSDNHNFVHLHVKSHYSIGNSVAKVNDIINAAKKYNMPAVCLTDLGNMFGTIEFYKEAVKNGIKPIIGLEISVMPPTIRRYREYIPPEQINEISTHNLVLLAKNNIGYKNLIHLSSACTFDFPQSSKHAVDFSRLEEYSDGLIALSGSISGIISSALLKGDREKAIYIINYYAKVFGKDNFYIELENTGLKNQSKLLSELVDITKLVLGYSVTSITAKRSLMPIVATNNCSFINHEDYEAFNDYQKILKNENNVFFDAKDLVTDEQYFKSPEEMESLFAEYPDAIINSVEIANRCNVEIKFGKTYTIDFPVPEGKTDESYVREICYEGLKENYGLNPSQKVIERLEEELAIIKKFNYFSYFLSVWKALNEAKNNNIVFSPGYGLTVGSMITYCMHITNVDPIKFGLSYKRFMNIENFIKPEIEIQYNYRDSNIINSDNFNYFSDFVNYLRSDTLFFPYFKKYNFSDSAKKIGNYLGLEEDIINKIKEYESFKNAVDDTNELKEIEENYSDKEKKLLRFAKIMNGLVYNVYTIPNSLVCSLGKRVLYNYLPITMIDSMREDIECYICSQYDKGTVEELGFPIFHFHSSDDLLFLKKIVNLIEETHENLYNQNSHLEAGSYLRLRLLYKICSATCQSKKLLGLNSEGNNYFEYGLLNYSDPHVYELFQKSISFVTGRIGWWLSYLRQHKNNPSVSELGDIVPLLALDKTYPVNPEIINSYFNRKLGLEEITYLHSDLEPILKETYGIYLYEEQVIDTAQIIAGLTLRQSEKFLEVLKKKNNDEKAEMIKKFIDGAIKNGIEANVAKEILNSMNFSTRRFYSKPHAVGQAVLLYRLLYLEAHYPAEFLTAELNMRMNQACYYENKKLRELEKREEFE